jgi:hypothetical protein
MMLLLSNRITVLKRCKQFFDHVGASPARPPGGAAGSSSGRGEACDSDVFSHPLNSGLKVPKSRLRRPLEFLAGGSLHGNEPRLDQLLLGDLRMSATSDT